MTAMFPGVVSQLFEPIAGQPAVLFTVDAPTGWRLFTYDAAGRATSVDFPDSTDAASPAAPSLAASWSPDGSRLAVAPITAPYNLFIFSRAGNLLNRVAFAEGYAGELKWSPDGQSLAVSTYSPDRTRHEIYLLSAAGIGQSRHLLSGCIIQWSPDSCFIVAKSEPHSTGVAIANVRDGSSWHILGYGGYVPLSWGVDEASALQLAQRPVRSAGTLGK
jgi:Tol biopolymer transport system component